jgi:hypothetical protein
VVPAGADWVEIAVRDQGPGIAPQVQKNLFVPFFTTKDRGTGLGLAISQRMVAEMGGRIEVASRAGEGSTFAVVLPVVTDTHTSQRPGPSGAQARTGGAESHPEPAESPASALRGAGPALRAAPGSSRA